MPNITHTHHTHCGWSCPVMAYWRPVVEEIANRPAFRIRPAGAGIRVSLHTGPPGGWSSGGTYDFSTDTWTSVNGEHTVVGPDAIQYATGGRTSFRGNRIRNVFIDEIVGTPIETAQDIEQTQAGINAALATQTRTPPPVINDDLPEKTLDERINEALNDQADQALETILTNVFGGYEHENPTYQPLRFGRQGHLLGPMQWLPDLTPERRGFDAPACEKPRCTCMDPATFIERTNIPELYSHGLDVSFKRFYWPGFRGEDFPDVDWMDDEGTRMAYDLGRDMANMIRWEN